MSETDVVVASLLTFKPIPHIVLVFYYYFEQVNAGWAGCEYGINVTLLILGYIPL